MSPYRASRLAAAEAWQRCQQGHVLTDEELADVTTAIRDMEATLYFNDLTRKEALARRVA